MTFPRSHRPPLSGNDEHWMSLALALAQQAKELDEVPVGAVLVRDEQELGVGFNRPLVSQDPTAHAEIIALRNAGRRQGNYRFPGSTLYVTVEPCTMCAGALVHARVERLVFGAAEPKAGAVSSTSAVLDNPALNHKIQVTGGVLANAAADLMQSFFETRRRRHQQ